VNDSLRHYHAFICYYRKSGAALAQLVRANLELHGLKVFLDVKADYWGPFPKELKDRVADTPYFIVLLTTGCLASSWMVLEISEAIRTGRRILVIRETDFVLPDETELEPSIRGLLYLNHITYVHDFSDEVIRRVVTMIGDEPNGPSQQARRRKRALWIAALLTVLALSWTAKNIIPWRTRPSAFDREQGDVRSAAQAASPVTPTAATTPLRLSAQTPAGPTAQEQAGSAALVVNDAEAPKMIKAPLSAVTPTPAVKSAGQRIADAPRATVTTHSPNAAAQSNCQPNYYFDQYGEKRFKAECF
jgi:hypothetical protein